MQKNNFKLKTIFKKGLSFSIALALGAAAISLNTAKIADAAEAKNDGSARTVYVAGERFDNTTGFTGATYYKTQNDTTTAFTAFNATPFTVSTGTHTLYLADDAAADGGKLAFEYTVVPTSGFTDVADANTFTLAEGTAFADARTAILDGVDWNDSITNPQGYSLVTAWGSSATFTIGGADFSSGNISYASHNGKDVSIKLPNGPTFKVGKLAVEKAVSKIELVSHPTNLGYSTSGLVDFSGLKIKVTYTDNTTEEVAYGTGTKSNFSFATANGAFAEGSKITADTAINVTYRGQTIENAFTLLLCATNATLEMGDVKVSGAFTAGNTLLVQGIDESSKKTLEDQFKKDFNTDALDILFEGDLSLTTEHGYINAVNVKIQLGKDYAGKYVTVKHLIDANTVESIVCKVTEDGYINFSTNTLSPFMVALGVKDEAAAAEAAKKAEEAAKKAEEAAKAKSGSGSAKTGDMSVIAFSVFGFVALISAAVLAYLKKARKSFDK